MRNWMSIRMNYKGRRRTTRLSFRNWYKVLLNWGLWQEFVNSRGKQIRKKHSRPTGPNWQGYWSSLPMFSKGRVQYTFFTKPRRRNQYALLMTQRWMLSLEYHRAPTVVRCTNSSSSIWIKASHSLSSGENESFKPGIRPLHYLVHWTMLVSKRYPNKQVPPGWMVHIGERILLHNGRRI